MLHSTFGWAWFSREERLKGRIKPCHFADSALLNAPGLQVADEELKHVEADLIVTGGTVAHATQKFTGLAPELPMIDADCSPMLDYGGFVHRWRRGLGVTLCSCGQREV